MPGNLAFMSKTAFKSLPGNFDGCVRSNWRPGADQRLISTQWVLIKLLINTQWVSIRLIDTRSNPELSSCTLRRCR